MSQLRIGGLASGMDIDSIVEKLMQAERIPLDKLEQQKQTYEWTRDAYRDVNKKLQTFDTYIADNLLLKSFNTKTASSTNSAFVDATATGSASGTLVINGVSQLATAASNVGEQINATSSSKLSDLGITGTGYFELKAIKSDGTMPSEATKIEYSDSMTVSQLMAKINNSGAGVTALFENGRLSISAKNTGDNKDGAEVELVSDENDLFKKFGFVDAKDNKILAEGGTNAVFQVNGIATERSTNTFSISGYTVTLKETFNVATTIANNLTAAQKELDNAKEDLEGRLTENRDKAISEYTEKIINDYQDKLNEVLGSSQLNETLQTIYNEFNNKEFLSKLTDDDIAQLSNLIVDPDATENDIKAAISANVNLSTELKEELHDLTKEQLVAISENRGSLVDLRTEAQRQIKEDNYNTLNKNFLNELSESDINTIVSINFSKEDPYDGVGIGEELKNTLNKLTTAQKKAIDNLSKEDLIAFQELAAVQIPHDEKLAAKEAAEKAYQAGKERLERAEANLETAKKAADNAGILNDDGTVNNEAVNAGGTINPVTLTSSTNVDEIIDKIKDFVNTYNGLIKELNDLTKEQKYRDYPPLTKAQRDEMDEKEIELWEEKAKSGLLRSDSILREGISNIRALIYKSNPAVSNTKFNTLFSIGITTSKNYNDGGTLEIDEAKLRKALEEDPDAVTALFTNTGSKEEKIIENGVEKTVDSRGYLYKLREEMTNIKNKIEKKAGRSTMTESQYTLGKTLRDINSRISDWQTKLKNIEDRYWKQFTAMEKAINKANMQASMFMPQY